MEVGGRGDPHPPPTGLPGFLFACNWDTRQTKTIYNYPFITTTHTPLVSNEHLGDRSCGPNRGCSLNRGARVKCVSAWFCMYESTACVAPRHGQACHSGCRSPARAGRRVLHVVRPPRPPQPRQDSLPGGRGQRRVPRPPLRVVVADAPRGLRACGEGGQAHRMGSTPKNTAPESGWWRANALWQRHVQSGKNCGGENCEEKVTKYIQFENSILGYFFTTPWPQNLFSSAQILLALLENVSFTNAVCVTSCTPDHSSRCPP